MKKTIRYRNATEKIILKFKDFNWKNWVIYCVLLFITGTFINIKSNYSFPNFVPHQLLLISATTMLVYAMKLFFVEVSQLASTVGRPAFSEDLLIKNPEVRSILNNKLLPLQRSVWPVLLAIFITGFFFTCIVLLEYIKLDVIGIYAIYIAGSSVLIGVYAYMQYLFFLWFIYRAGKGNSQNYNHCIPAETAWIAKIAKISQTLRNLFLLIGLIYVIEYAILIPADKITVTDAIVSFDMPNNIAFVISWVALFLLVIIAFPVINYIQHKLIAKLIEDLKMKRINELSNLISAEEQSGKDSTTKLTKVLAYSVMMENVRQSKSYPIERQISYEAIMTVLTFFVHVLNLYSKFASVSPLSSLLPQF